MSQTQSDGLSFFKIDIDVDFGTSLVVGGFHQRDLCRKEEICQFAQKLHLYPLIN